MFWNKTGGNNSRHRDPDGSAHGRINKLITHTPEKYRGRVTQEGKTDKKQKRRRSVGPLGRPRIAPVGLRHQAEQYVPKGVHVHRPGHLDHRMNFLRLVHPAA